MLVLVLAGRRARVFSGTQRGKLLPVSRDFRRMHRQVLPDFGVDVRQGDYC